jgi:hypothetical protein
VSYDRLYDDPDFYVRIQKIKLAICLWALLLWLIF